MTDAYLRFPHLHDDLITFVAEDDVWLAPVDGGRAWRVSADQVPARSPRFAPDGRTIAWTSTRDSEPEVYAAPVDGGSATRLTYWGDVRTRVVGWTPSGEVLATSSTGRHSTRQTWPYAVPLDGSPARVLPYGPVDAVDVAASGAVVLGTVVSREPAWWKRYRGGAMGKVWVDANGDGVFERVLADVEGHIASPMWVGGRIAFLSDHDGVGNLYSCEVDGSDIRRHSAHEFYARNASTDGTRVVYHCAGELWLLDGLDSAPHRVDIRLGGPRGPRAPRPLEPEHELEDVAPDHTGRGSVVEVRGTTHWLTHRDGPARVLSAEPGVRARLPVVLGDTGRAAWVTDADGEEALEVADITGGQRRRIASGQVGRVLELAASPDGRWLGVVSHDGRLLVVDATGDTGTREVARARAGDPDGLVFSPDSAWLAWSHPGPDPLRHIRMARTDDLSIVDVTPLRFADHDPAFTLDGEHLAFLSARSFEPVYDAHVFDMSFTDGVRPYLVPLSATTPSPFAPSPDGRPAGSDKDDDDKSDEDTPGTSVDVEGLADRVVPFPVRSGKYSSLLAVKGGVLWLRDPATGGDSGDTPSQCRLERFDLTKSRPEPLADTVDEVWATGDGQRIVVRDGHHLRVLPADQKVDDDSEDSITVDLDRVRVTLDPAAEWRQCFDEAGRLMRDHFWRADMSGVDWTATLTRYRPLVDALGSHDELVDLLWEVQGELGTSHAYVTPPTGWVDNRTRLGLLGADLAADDDGVWRVTSIIPGETSDPRARSPLRAPGVAVRVGDGVVAVDGRPVDPLRGPAPLLVGAAGNPVELTVAPADGGGHRRVVVVPLLDDMPLRYQAWVNERRAHVHAASGGRLGYIHIPDMVANGWAQLHRDFRLEIRRDGLVVDFRDNGGGHLSQLVIEKLSRRITGWTIARDGYYEETYPLDAPRGPIVAVSDEFTGSDGDIVTAAVRAMGIGPVVGTRTWGGVIGIDLRYHLVDGTSVTQPRYATWMRGPGWGLENHGVSPDQEVPFTPQDHARGTDPQLDTAVAVAMAALADTPPATPPDLP